MLKVFLLKELEIKWSNIFQGIINDFSESSSEINLSYYNPHGNTSIEYAANISTQDSVVQPPQTASNRFVRYPLLLGSQ